MTTIIFTGKTGQEIKVATFKNENEAIQCAELLQAKCADQDYCYYQTVTKNNRKSVGSFAHQINFLNKDVQNNIKLMLTI